MHSSAEAVYAGCGAIPVKPLVFVHRTNNRLLFFPSDAFWNYNMLVKGTLFVLKLLLSPDERACCHVCCSLSLRRWMMPSWKRWKCKLPKWRRNWKSLRKRSGVLTPVSVMPFVELWCSQHQQHNRQHSIWRPFWCTVHSCCCCCLREQWRSARNVKISSNRRRSSSNGGVAQWLGRRTLAGGLSPICAWSMVDMWPLCG